MAVGFAGSMQVTRGGVWVERARDCAKHALCRVWKYSAKDRIGRKVVQVQIIAVGHLRRAPARKENDVEVDDGGGLPLCGGVVIVSAIVPSLPSSQRYPPGRSQ